MSKEILLQEIKRAKKAHLLWVKRAKHLIQDLPITEDMIPDISKQPELIAAAEKAGELLGQRLSNDHDRSKVTEKMQKIMMEKFKSST